METLMLTHDELNAKAQKYANAGLTCGEEGDVQNLLVNRYVLGFMQGYTVAGGIVSADEKRAATPPATEAGQDSAEN